MNYTNRTETINIYFQEIRKFQSLTRDDEVALFTRIAMGDNSAVTEIFNRVAKLAVAVAKTYTSDPDILQDVIQEANCGILEAIRKFDLSTGWRFSSYARFWMKAYISKYLNERMTVRSTNVNLLLLVKKIRSQFFQENHREISDYELLDMLEERGEMVTDLSVILTIKVDSLSGVFGDDRTLDETPEFNNQSASVNDCLCVEDNEELADDIAYLLSKLDNRERTMVRMKFGIGYDREQEYPEIAKQWEVISGKPITAERVRQIVTAAVKKMR